MVARRPGARPRATAGRTELRRAAGGGPGRSSACRVEARAGRAGRRWPRQAAAPLLQTAALLRGATDSWAGQADEALLAQGRASAQGAALVRPIRLPGSAWAARRPGPAGRPHARRRHRRGRARGGLCAAVARADGRRPRRPPTGAGPRGRDGGGQRRRRSRRRPGSRTSRRWTSPPRTAWRGCRRPFVPEAALRAGVEAISRALLPGGWLMLGHGKFTGDPLDDRHHQVQDGRLRRHRPRRRRGRWAAPGRRPRRCAFRAHSAGGSGRSRWAGVRSDLFGPSAWVGGRSARRPLEFGVVLLFPAARCPARSSRPRCGRPLRRKPEGLTAWAGSRPSSSASSRG